MPLKPGSNIAAMCRDYLQEQRELLASGEPGLSPRTIADYADALERKIIPRFGQMLPRQFKPTHAAQYLYEARKLKRAIRANREIAALASAFNHGLALGLCDSNPCRGVRRNRERPRSRQVAIAELNQLLAMAAEEGPGQYMVALIACTIGLTGRRRAEILALRDDQLTAEGVVAHDAKTRSYEAQRVYLVEWSPLLRQVIEQAAKLRTKRNGWVFPSRFGRPYSDSGFKAVWNRLMHQYEAKHGSRFRAHDLRSLYVSEMLDQGRDPHTHRNKETMHRVYDRRKVVRVTPLA